MSDLNYILLTGTLKNNPVHMYRTDRNCVCTMEIENIRHTEKPDKSGTDMRTTSIRIKAVGTVAEAYCKVLTAERGIRVVGRIESDDTGLYVMAEHIEFRPVKKSC